MRAVLRCTDAPAGFDWPQLLLRTRVAGVPVLQRHLLAWRHAGIAEVWLVVPAPLVPEVEHDARALVPPGMTFHLTTGSGLNSAITEPNDDPVFAELRPDPVVLEQRGDTIIDPRLLAQIVRLASAEPAEMICLDAADPAARGSAKSPYTVGVPDADEAVPVGPDAAARMVPIGLAVHLAGSLSPIALDVGRCYWRRVRGREDGGAATRAILLATMKATDGIFARTNRRVSLRISQLLLPTPMTPNMVTIATLLWGLAAAWLLSRGTHATFVGGALFAWFASMLDGVDGELARAKFQTSPFGHWLEMACDYTFYIALFVGLGAGVQQVKGDPIWLFVGIGAGAGVLFSFAAVAHLKRSYARSGSIGDFYLAYQQTVRTPGGNPFLRITPWLIAMMSRAGFPYVLFVIALLDMPRGMLVTIFVATHSFWIVALYVSRFRVALRPASPAVAEVEAPLAASSHVPVR